MRERKGGKIEREVNKPPGPRVKTAYPLIVLFTLFSIERTLKQ